MKDVLGRKIVMAPSVEIERNRESVDRLLLMVGEYMGWEGDTSHVFVSDMTTLGDFNLEESEMEELSRKVGFPVARSDELKDVALRMGAKQ
jgi:hypothetical protein